MARIDYFSIEDELGSLIRADETVQGVQVTVEGDVEIEAGALVAIYLDRRDPTSGQSLSAGTRTRFQIKFIIWCWEYSLDSMSDAMKKRDDLVGKVEIILMKNRTISNKVSTSWLAGGAMPAQQLEGDFDGYVAGGEIVLIAEAVAVT